MAGAMSAVELAAHVQAREAAAFTQLFSGDKLTREMQRIVVETACGVMCTEAKAAFGAGTRASVQRRGAEGDASAYAELLVDTTQPVSRAQCRELGVRLQVCLKVHPFNGARVTVTTYGLRVRVRDADVELVCANTVEHGRGTRPKARAPADALVQHVVQALDKLCDSSRATRDISAAQLGGLVAHCKAAPCVAARVGDGAMQLFVRVLQCVVDGDPPGAAAAASLDAALHGVLQQLARSALHVFVLARVVLPDACFRDVSEVSAWVMHVRQEECDTPAGRTPSWLFQSPAKRRRESLLAVFTDCTPSQAPGAATHAEEGAGDDEDWHNPNALRLLMQSPLGAYTLAGADAALRGFKSTSVMAEQLTALTHHAACGSAVAQRMLATRTLWLQGESKMRAAACGKGSAARAVQLLAASLRASVADGDPFSGWFNKSTGGADMYAPYHAVADAALAADPASVDALLVRADVFMNQCRNSEAEAAVRACLALAPGDAYGALQVRMKLNGNMGRWRECLVDCDAALALHPEEPMFHYWRAVARRNVPEWLDAAGLAATLADYRRFLELASPEGRKVCEALYSMAMLETVHVMQTSKKALLPAALEKLARDVRAAQAAEAAKLPVFGATDCDQKTWAESMLKMLAQRDGSGAPSPGTSAAPPAATLEALRKRGNDAFAARDFKAAAEAYTHALQLAPQQAELLANRAAAHNALRWFTAGATDAVAAAAARPEYAKAHYRAAQAHMGRKDGAAALAAATRAAELLPQDDNIARVKADAALLAAQQAATSPPSDVRAHAECWERVMFKERVHVVCASGGAAFACVADALHALRPQATAGGVTLVLLPGIYEEHSLSLEDGGQWQLLGWNALAEDEDSAGAEAAELRRLDVKVDDESPHLLAVLGASTRVHLARLLLVQPTGMPITNGGACVSCVVGAEVSVTDCIARTPDSPCFMVFGSAATRLTLDGVRVDSSSAAAVVEQGVLTASGCTFTGCVLAAVEARRGGSAKLRGCAFSRCVSQACILYSDGKALQLTDCTLRACGDRERRRSAVLVESGLAVLRGCTLEDNPGDAVVLQGNGAADGTLTTPALLMDACHLARNEAGVCVFYGSGVLSSNTLTAHREVGCKTNGVSAGKTLALRGNTFSKNGPRNARCDVLVMGHTLMQQSVQLDADNVLAVPPKVFSDADMHAAYAHMQRTGGLAADARVQPPAPPPAGAPKPRMGWQLPKEATIAEHMRELARLEREFERLDPQEPLRRDNSSASTRPSPTPAPGVARRLARVRVAELQLGETHTGRVLRGTLVVPPRVVLSMFTLLEDAAGDLVRVCVYDTLPPGMSPAARLAEARRLLPQGARVTITEPYFKQFADGTYGVRIDDVAQIRVRAPEA
jgi:hypothetical protein